MLGITRILHILKLLNLNLEISLFCIFSWRLLCFRIYITDNTHKVQFRKVFFIVLQVISTLIREAGITCMRFQDCSI